MPSSSSGKIPRSRGRTGARYLNLRRRTLENNRICQFKGNDKWPPCGELIDLDLAWPHPMSGTIDHLIPVHTVAWDDPSLYSPDTTVPMHLVCNQRKGKGGTLKGENPTSRDWFD